MSKIDLRTFVDINIKRHAMSTVESSRDVSVLLSNEGTDSSIDKTYNSLSEVQADLEAEAYPNTIAAAKAYFDNGGAKLHIKVVVVAASASTFTDDALKAAILALPDKEIVVGFTGDYDNEGTSDGYPAAMKRVAMSIEADTSIYGIKEKILVGRSTTDDTSSIKNFGVKRSSVQGAEMSIAAYLSGIDVYGIDTVKDYCYTKEILTAEAESNEVVTECISHNMNVAMNISGNVINIGGNAKDGQSIVNSFCLIVLQQTTTDRVFNAITQKLKGSSGLAVLSTVIGQELAKYVTSGYLVTDKSWTDRDLVISYNSNSYTIIKQGELLPLGYKVVILPYNDLSEADKAERKTPPIYVVIADTYGIRKVTLNGEVI